MVKEIFFADKEQLTLTLVNECANALQAGINARGQASFLVSGGSTPAPIYKGLSEYSLAWEQINVALVDERWVEQGQDGSNCTFIGKNLLQGKASRACFLGMKNAHVTAAEGWADCEDAYKKIPRPYDLCILGMGNDGHTASLFPQAEGLEAALEPETSRLCAPIIAAESAVTGALTERMTLTLGAILQAREIKLLFTGEEKLQVYRQACQGSDEQAMPVRSILKQTIKLVTVYWAP